MSLDTGHQFNIAANLLDPSVTAQHELLPLKGERKKFRFHQSWIEFPNLHLFSSASCDSIWLENQALRNES